MKEIKKTTVDMEVASRTIMTSLIAFSELENNRMSLGIDYLEDSGIELDASTGRKVQISCKYFAGHRSEVAMSHSATRGRRISAHLRRET